jgi:septal ring factor EnvC (AmiA/AmiB activator)
MINEQVMMDTVNRLIGAGIDDPTIISTLTDAGLSQDEAFSVLQKARAPPSPAPASAPLAAPIAAEDVQLLKNQVEAQAEQHDLHQTVTQNTLNMHEQKLDEVTKQVEEVKQSVAQTAPTDPGLAFKVSQLEEKLEDVSAVSKANNDLLRKILETNQKILTDLEAKK